MVRIVLYTERSVKKEVANIELRQYQADIINNVKAELKNGKSSILVVLGCGGGKSIIQGCISASATAKGNRVLFLVHRRELCEQISATFAACGVDMRLCEIMMVQTATRRLDKLSKPKLIITDECHHSLSDSYRRIYDAFPGIPRLGFTATPVRLGYGGLGEVYDALVEGVSTAWLIENHYLAPYRYFSVKLADASDLHIAHGDYKAPELAALMEKSCIYGDTVDNWQSIAQGMKTIVYCASVEASKQTAARFCESGVSAAHLDGTTPTAERAETIRRFRSGEITVLSNVDLFGEGFDVPDCECVVLLRPTKSLTLFIQQSMRSMRYKDGKTAYIIDHVGNVFEHGFPDDTREWTLKARRRAEKPSITLRQCPICFMCVPGAVTVCPMCGAELVKHVERGERETVAAKLEELSRSAMLAAKPGTYYKELTTWSELIEFQKAKKYSFAWAIHKAEEKKIEIPGKYKYMRRYLSGARR